MARRATAALAAGDELLLADLVVAECVYVLESFYEVPRERVAELMRAAIAPLTLAAANEVPLQFAQPVNGLLVAPVCTSWVRTDGDPARMQPAR